ncbi:MAG: response regulator [Actinomycetota bacterium]
MAGQKPSILIVDDDPVIRRLLQVNFRLEGYEVETAALGQESIELARSNTPDVIVLDVMMPGMDGWEVCRSMREESSLADVPIVFLSAKSQDQNPKDSKELGIAAYVTKPFDPSELVTIVERALDHRR